MPVRVAGPAHERGELPMLPPTITTLRQVAVHPTVAQVLRRDRPPRPDPPCSSPSGRLHVELPDGTFVPLPRAEL